MRGHRHPHPSSAAGPATPLAARAGVLAPARCAHHLIDAFLEAARRDDLAADPTVADSYEVLEPQIERIHPELAGELVDLAFARKCDLRVPEASKSTRTQ